MGLNQFDYVGLNLYLLTHVRSLLPRWLPGGRFVGQEYCCADITGGNGNSFKVNIRTGAWCDFAQQDHRGGDLNSLFAKINGFGQLEAAKTISKEVGFQFLPATNEMPEISQPPAGTPQPTMQHRQFGKPSAAWTYRNELDDVLFYVARYDPIGGKKQIVPWAWSNTVKRFVMRALPPPRPLYGLELLSKKPHAPVMLVEGEKAADAARIICGHIYHVLSWPNGGQSVSKVNWEPIYGRKILLWPDADDAGVSAMRLVAEILSPHCQEVKIIDVSDHKDGWDAADALNDGWNFQHFFEWAKPKVALYAVSSVEVMAAETSQAISDAEEEELNKPALSHVALWAKMGVAVSKNGFPIVNADNALRFLEGYPPLKDVIWHDDFHCKLFTTWESEKAAQWSEGKETSLLIFLQRELGFQKLTMQTLQQAALVYAEKHSRNEPRDWMDSLTWDNEQRIESFFIRAFGAKDTEYSRAASKNFWVSMAARIYRPGCKADEMIVLEGAQGTFKSTALSIIGGEWYGQATAKPGDKDFYQGLQGKLLIEIAELSSFSKVDINIIKKDLSSAYDDIRPSYGRFVLRFPRTCVFAGTTNEKSYINDATGGRRFWPVEIGKIDIDYVTEFRNQFFAEATAAYKAGSPWHEMPIAETLAQQEARQIHDEWGQVIAEYLVGRPQVTIEDIAKTALEVDVGKLDVGTQRRIGRILDTLGWVKRNRRSHSGKQFKLWVAREEREPGDDSSFVDN